MTERLQMSRRGILFGLAAAICAPAIVRAEMLMPVRSFVPAIDTIFVDPLSGSDHLALFNPAMAFRTIQAAVDFAARIPRSDTSIVAIQLSPGAHECKNGIFLPERPVSILGPAFLGEAA